MQQFAPLSAIGLVYARCDNCITNIIREGNSMIDTFFEKTYNEEFNKIPCAFRFTRSMRTTFFALIVLWAIIDISLSGPAIKGSAITHASNYSSWTVFIIANLVLVAILTWGVIGTAFEKMAFKRASRLDRLHKDWVNDQIEKEIRNIRNSDWDYEQEFTQKTASTDIRYCPRCGLPLEDGEDLCELCRAEKQ